MRFSPICLAASIVMSVYCTAHFGFCIPLYITLFLLCILYSAIKHNIDLVLFIMLAAFVTGGISYKLSTSEFIHKSISHINKEVTLTGVTLSSAQESGDNYKYVFYAKTLNTAGKSYDVNDTVLLTTPQKLKCNQSITLNGTLKPMQEQMNENGFDTARHYKSQGIFTRIYSKNISPSEHITVFSPLIMCGKFREWTDNCIYKYYRNDGAAVLSAILTGNTHHFSDEFNSVLNNTDFRHLYHPAFLHILIISALVGLFTNILNKKLRTIALIVILLVYAIFNCAQIGFTRCIITTVLIIFFRMKNGSSYYLDAVAWMLTAAAIFMPSVLFNVGFILSTTAGVIMWAFRPYFYIKFAHLSNSKRKTASAVAVCALIYTPLSLFFYNGVCIYTLLMPFIAAPLVLLILVTAPIVFAMLALFGTALPIKPYLDAALLILLKLPQLIHKLPFSRIILPTPSISGMLLVICLVFVFYYHIKEKRLHRHIFAALSCGFTLSIIISAFLRIGTTEFIFVNVGQGDGAVIHTAYGATVLIDGGGSAAYSDYNPGESIYLPYLEAKGYTRIDAAFITHFHNDHAQGIIAAIENLKVDNVFFPAPEDDWDNGSISLMREAINAANRNGTKIHYITENKMLTFDRGLSISVYAPNAVIKLSDNENDSSLLIKAKYGSTSVLYTGDMSTFAESEYIKQGIDLSADVLKVGHHGSASSTQPEWVDAVNPSYAVISCGKDNVHGHPKPQTLNNLRGIPILRTDLQGDINITADKNKIRKITTFK